MENMSLDEKLKLLKSHRDWKCQKKWEVLDEHDATWRTNGLSDLAYSVLSRRAIGGYCTVITVDIGLNQHWTDRESHMAI
jgi:hypothetical protein